MCKKTEPTQLSMGACGLVKLEDVEAIRNAISSMTETLKSEGYEEDEAKQAVLTFVKIDVEDLLLR